MIIMAQEYKEKASVILVHGIPTLWNEKDCHFIRRHRILGTPIGPLPKFVSEKKHFGLPLRLMKEEAKLLLDKGLCDAIVELTPATVLFAAEQFKHQRIEHQKAVNEVHSRISFEERKAEIFKVAEKILEGRRKKLRSSASSSGKEDTLTVENVIAEEVDKISNRESKFVELCMEHPCITEIPLKKVDWDYPSTRSEKLRYAVFKDLWEKQFFISCGIKFGGNFLVYHEDPDFFHASFIVKCVEDEEEIDACDLVAAIRVGTVTKKTLVLASLDKNNVQYQSFHWTGLDLTAL